MNQDPYDAGILIYGNKGLDKKDLTRFIHELSSMVDYGKGVDIYIPTIDTPLCCLPLGNSVMDFVYAKRAEDYDTYPVDYRVFQVDQNKLYSNWFIPQKIQKALCITTPFLFEKSRELKSFHIYVNGTFPEIVNVLMLA